MGFMYGSRVYAVEGFGVYGLRPCVGSKQKKRIPSRDYIGIHRTLGRKSKEDACVMKAGVI